MIQIQNLDHLIDVIEKEIQAKGVDVDLNHLDVSGLTELCEVFSTAGIRSQFNGDISRWDVSNVTNMSLLFSNSVFNGDISRWNVSNVTDMHCMFARSAFNQDISKWDVSRVVNMQSMFLSAIFNQPLNDWDVSNVENMWCMFHFARFNRPLNRWNVKKVKTGGLMFAMALDFEEDVSGWEIASEASFESAWMHSGWSKKLGVVSPSWEEIARFCQKEQWRRHHEQQWVGEDEWSERPRARL